MKKNEKAWGYGGAFSYYTEKAFNMIALSLLWLVCSIPIITVGAANAALYHSAQKTLKNEQGYIFQEFFRSFCLNFKPSLGIWLMIAVMTFVFQLNMGIVAAKMNGNIEVFFLLFYGLCLTVTLGIHIYVFPALSKFDMPSGWIMKLAVYLCFRHLPRTVLLIGLTLGVLVLIYLCMPLVLILPCLLAYVSGSLIEPVLEPHMPMQNKELLLKSE